MASMTRTIESIDVSAGSGLRTVRVSVSRTPDGKAESLVLSSGFGTGPEFMRHGWDSPPMTLPASLIGDLREALARLEAGP